MTPFRSAVAVGCTCSLLALFAPRVAQATESAAQTTEGDVRVSSPWIVAESLQGSTSMSRLTLGMLREAAPALPLLSPTPKKIRLSEAATTAIIVGAIVVGVLVVVGVVALSKGPPKPKLP